MRTATARRVQDLRFVPLEQWFPPRRDPRAGAGFYTPLQEDFYAAFVNSRAAIRSQRVCTLEAIVAAGGEEVRPLITYLPGLAELLGMQGKYVED